MGTIPDDRKEKRSDEYAYAICAELRFEVRGCRPRQVRTLVNRSLRPTLRWKVKQLRPSEFGRGARYRSGGPP
jgi:hypothetical protein